MGCCQANNSDSQTSPPSDKYEDKLLLQQEISTDPKSINQQKNNEQSSIQQQSPKSQQRSQMQDQNQSINRDKPQDNRIKSNSQGKSVQPSLQLQKDPLKQSFTTNDFFKINCESPVSADKLYQEYSTQTKINENSEILISNTTQIKVIMRKVKKSIVNQNLFQIYNYIQLTDNRNIAKVLRQYEDQENRYIIQEYCDGENIIQKFKKLDSYTEKNCSGIVRQILGAVI